MRVGLMTTRKKPGREGSVMAEVAQKLAERGHSLEFIYPDDELVDIARVDVDYDLYILKAGSPAALAYAAVLDLAGARILNPYEVVIQMKDKVLASRILADAEIPAPEAFIASDPKQFSHLLDESPLVIKPYLGGSQGRGVQIVRTRQELEEIPVGDGLLFVQRYHQPEGRDYKIYRIGQSSFGVRRVWPARTLEDKLGEAFELTPSMLEISDRCGEAFGIDLYGLDIVISQGREYVVDINTFPGFKGVPDAGLRLAEYISDYLNRPSDEYLS
jgi:ribosomal protein S6--L-glutamate ligase